MKIIKMIMTIQKLFGKPINLPENEGHLCPEIRAN